MAGLGPDRKSKEDIEFQLLVIKNDHCYTPFTSPSQMKAKLAADKLESEKQPSNRKMTPSHQLQTATGKQLFVRKKPQQKTELSSKFPNSQSTTKDKCSSNMVSKVVKENRETKKAIEDERDDEESDIRQLDENEESKTGTGAEDEESESSAVEETDESDNDRDSDLDFDVNNPKGRRKKIRNTKIKRPVGASKIQQKTKRLHAQEDNTDNANKSCTNMSIAMGNRQKTAMKGAVDVGRITIRSTPTKILNIASNILSPAIAALAPIPKKQTDNKILTTPTANIKSMTVKCTNAKQTLSPQTHKEIVINKQIMCSPKSKGFTDLNTLMDQNEQKETLGPTPQLTSPKASLHTTPIIVPSKAITPLKGFMPIGVETASKNQLPAQISIQTHQSSSELEAEHDKQLDLINSIVQDEMQKPNDIIMPASNIIENIPELVKMLESTEAALAQPLIALNKQELKIGEHNDSPHCDNSNIRHTMRPESNTKISDIDMGQASLLHNTDPDDDLPDDILQQVVDLIKDDKTLQEAVDVLGSGDSNDPMTNTSNISNQNPPPLAPISQQGNNKNILEVILFIYLFKEIAHHLNFLGHTTFF